MKELWHMNAVISVSDYAIWAKWKTKGCFFGNQTKFLPVIIVLGIFGALFLSSASAPRAPQVSVDAFTDGAKTHGWHRGLPL